MKKIVSIFVSLMAVSFLVNCGGGNKPSVDKHVVNEQEFNDACSFKNVQYMQESVSSEVSDTTYSSTCEFSPTVYYAKYESSMPTYSETFIHKKDGGGYEKASRTDKSAPYDFTDAMEGEFLTPKDHSLLPEFEHVEITYKSFTYDSKAGTYSATFTPPEGPEVTSVLRFENKKLISAANSGTGGVETTTYTYESKTPEFPEEPTPPSSFTVTWINWDGEVLEIDENLSYGDMPDYNGDSPTKNNDETFSYEFVGWTPSVVPVTESTTYCASYCKHLIGADNPSVVAKIVIPNDAQILRVGFSCYSFEENTDSHIDWGDGSSDDTSDYIVHPYAQPGTYQIKIYNADIIIPGDRDEFDYSKDYITEFYFNTMIYAPITECSALTSITISSNVSYICPMGFGYCPSLEYITVDSNNSIYDSRNNCNAIIETSTNSLITGCKNTNIFDGVTKIDAAAFSDCISLESISIPDSIISIGLYAFYGCSSLTSITIPGSVTSIDENVFSNCSSLKSITVDSDNPTYDSRNNCNAIITKVDIKDDDGEIITPMNTLICGCSNTTIPNSVTSIDDYAFSGSSLTSITIPSSVTSIGLECFSYCSSLKSITVDSNNPTYDSRNNCNAIITKVDIKDDDGEIITPMNTLIYGCSGTTIPDSVISIGGKAFIGSSLASIDLNNVQSILLDAFHDCALLQSVDLKNVISIDDSAFYGCSSLTSITIPSSVTSIGEGITSYCSSLNYITVDSNNPTYDSRNNCNAIIETSGSALIAGCNGSVIVEGIGSIGLAAFVGCASLTTIKIPASVSFFAKNNFAYCTSLSLVDMSDYTDPANIPSTESTTFKYCTLDIKFKVANQAMRDAFINSDYPWPKDSNSYIIAQ